MEIIVAESSGFCMGVRRAVDIALEQASISHGPIYTMGPLIHNNQAVAYLENKGIVVANSPPKSGTVVIRAHGVPPQTISSLEEAGVTVIDATCPIVLSSQKIIDRERELGRYVVIVGDERHPEVRGLCGHAPGAYCVIGDEQGLDNIEVDQPISLIAQTTHSSEGYKKICAKAKTLFPDCHVFDTICDATERRQTEVVELCSRCDALVVVGGRNSANTCRLAQIGRECGVKVYHVETSVELVCCDFSDVNTVAVTAGASTPDCVVQMVLMRLKQFAAEGCE